jgi:hypothetical protein
LTRYFILHSIYDAEHQPPIGRPPYCEDLIFRRSARVQAEVAAFAAKYRRLTAEGITPAQALITAFTHYRSIIRQPSISFDEAFFVICGLEGIWAASTRMLELGACRRCGCLHLLPYGAAPAAAGCPFCRSHRSDGAVAWALFPSHPEDEADATDADAQAATVPAALEAQIRALRTRRAFESLGAHPRVAASLSGALASGDASAPRGDRAPPTQVVRRINPSRWGVAINTVRRAQFSLMAVTYARLLAAGFEPTEAVRAAFMHVRTMFPTAELPCFDRCFEIISMFDVHWGAAEPSFDLLACPKCRARFLSSRHDRVPPHCPFCTLLRKPEKYL